MADFNGNRNYDVARPGGGRGGNNRNEPLTLPTGYLQGGYYNDTEKLKLKKEYIVDYPKDIANLLERDGGRDTNKRSQIRRFYEYLLRVESKMNLPNNDFSSIEADFMELVPHVTYAGQRRVVSKMFIEFIEKNAAAVHDEKDVRAFVKHFEAVIAFTKKD